MVGLAPRRHTYNIRNFSKLCFSDISRSSMSATFLATQLKLSTHSQNLLSMYYFGIFWINIWISVFVFQNSALYQHLQDVGFTENDVEVVRPIKATSHVQKLCGKENDGWKKSLANNFMSIGRFTKWYTHCIQIQVGTGSTYTLSIDK